MIFREKSYAGSTGLLQNKRFVIQWIPDLFCNYSCSYCWPGSNSPNRNHLPVEILIKGLSDLKSKVNNMGIHDFHLSFAGGEPTVYPGFLELVQSYCDDKTQKRQSMNVTTNLTFGDKWWNNFFEITRNLDNLTINASWHRESVKDRDLSRIKFLRISNQMKSMNRHFVITMVISPSQFDDVYFDALFFRKHGANVVIRPERIMHKGILINHPDYTQEMLDSIFDWNMGKPISPFIHVEDNIIKYDDVEQAISLDKTNYKGWLCYAGSTGIRIKPNGDIGRGFGCIDKKIGNIIDNSYVLDPNPKPCITQKCFCASDMNKPKIKKD